jgi:hypothetical protein
VKSPGGIRAWGVGCDKPVVAGVVEMGGDAERRGEFQSLFA